MVGLVAQFINLSYTVLDNDPFLAFQIHIYDRLLHKYTYVFNEQRNHAMSISINHSLAFLPLNHPCIFNWVSARIGPSLSYANFFVNEDNSLAFRGW